MIDKRLLILEKYIEKNDETPDNLSVVLGVSDRQLARMLNRWALEGYISYSPGKGRGNKTKVRMKIDIEKELFYELMSIRQDIPIEELEKYLSLPWNAATMELIKRTIYTDYRGVVREKGREVLMDYIYRIPDELHPAHTSDYASFKVAYNTMDRLYEIDKSGNINYGLIKYDEWNEGVLNLYMKKGIYFCDGSELTAHDVRKTLETLKTEGIYQDNFKIINEVKVHTNYHLSIKVNGHYSILKYYLSGLYSSIGKMKNDGTPIGTGAYQIQSVTDNYIILTVNPYYRPKPEVQEIHLLANREKLQKYYKKTSDAQVSYSIYYGDSFFVFNPLNDRFTNREREWLKSVFLNVMYRNKGTSDQPEKPLSNDNAVIGEVPDFHFAIRFIVNEYTENKMNKVIRVLGEYDVDTEVIYYGPDEYFTLNLQGAECDVVLFQSTVSQYHPYKLLDLLTYTIFKDWYAELEAMKNFLEYDRNADFENITSDSRKIINSMISGHYLIPLFKHYRHLNLPEGFKGIVESSHSMIDYRKIIIPESKSKSR